MRENRIDQITNKANNTKEQNIDKISKEADDRRKNKRMKKYSQKLKENNNISHKFDKNTENLLISNEALILKNEGKFELAIKM